MIKKPSGNNFMLLLLLDNNALVVMFVSTLVDHDYQPIRRKILEKCYLNVGSHDSICIIRFFCAIMVKPKK